MISVFGWFWTDILRKSWTEPNRKVLKTEPNRGSDRNIYAPLENMSWCCIKSGGDSKWISLRRVAAWRGSRFLPLRLSSRVTSLILSSLETLFILCGDWIVLIISRDILSIYKNMISSSTRRFQVITDGQDETAFAASDNYRSLTGPGRFASGPIGYNQSENNSLQQHTWELTSVSLEKG